MRQMTKTRKMSGIPVNMGKKGQHVKFWNEFGKFIRIKGDHFRFGSVFIKKSNQTEIFFFKKIKTRSNRPVSVRFFREKTGSNRFGSIFLGFPGFGSVFSFWLGFFRFRFGFFGFLLIKPKPNRTGRSFQNFNRFNRFFFSVRFFRFFFPVFSV